MSQVQLQTPRDEEEEGHGRSQVSGRAGCGPWALTSRWRRTGKYGRTSAFGLTEAWGRVRPGLSSGKWCAGRRGLQGEDWRLGISVRVLTGAYCQEVAPRLVLVLFAKHPPGLVLCCLQSASCKMPHRRPGNLGFVEFVGNTVSSVKIRRLATPRGQWRRGGGGGLSKDFVLSGGCAQPYFRTQSCRSTAGSLLRQPLKTAKSAVLSYIPDIDTEPP